MDKDRDEGGRHLNVVILVELTRCIIQELSAFHVGSRVAFLQFFQLGLEFLHLPCRLHLHLEERKQENPYQNGKEDNPHTNLTIDG